jgi:hypothetical protein
MALITTTSFMRSLALSLMFMSGATNGERTGPLSPSEVLTEPAAWAGGVGEMEEELVSVQSSRWLLNRTTTTSRFWYEAN